MPNYSRMVSSSMPFPPVSWWVMAAEIKNIALDVAEHYQKMSYRNRYYLAGPAGKVLMSLPLQQGRNQRRPAGEVKIAQQACWQAQQWKSITSLYRKSPFFEYFEHRLIPLFKQPYEYLHEWNKAGIQLVIDLLKLDISLGETNSYRKQYPEDTLDIRTTFLPQSEPGNNLPQYRQVFSDRSGFQPDCSILDLLFCEGNHAGQLLHFKSG